MDDTEILYCLRTLIKNAPDFIESPKVMERYCKAINSAIELAQAKQEGRLVALPCKVGDTVYTIEEEYFDCPNCPHGNEAHYDKKINRICCDLEDCHCPYSIKEHCCEGFDISGDENDPIISGPGEWGYERLEHFQGVDGKWYLTRESAEAEKERSENGQV